MIYLLAIMVVVGIAYVAGASVFGHFKGDGAELKATKAKLRIAEGGLRKIANGISGSPELDAQNTLEDIDTNNSKEITR